MAYYCRKCKRWHTGGQIARSHTVFSARPPRSGLRPQTTRKRQTIPIKRQPSRKIIKKKPILAVIKKKKPVRVKTKDAFTPARKPRMGLSRMRRGQLAMKPGDIHENKMVQRLRSKTGMTHVQVMNLVNLAKKSDYIDVETEILGAGGLSRDKTETYEFAKKRILKKLDQFGDIMTTSKYNDPSYFEDMQADYLHQLEWERQAKKFKKKANLI